MFIRMDAYAFIVFIQTSFNIIRNTDVPVFAIYGFKTIDKMHSGIFYHKWPGFVRLGCASSTLRRGTRLRHDYLR